MVHESPRRDIIVGAGAISASRLTRRTLLRAVGGTVGFAAFSGLLAACGSSSNESTPSAAATSAGQSSGGATTPTTASVATSASTPAAAASPVSSAAATTASGSTEGSGIAIFATAVDIPNIDPAVGHDGAISTTQKHLYDTLYRHTGNPPELVPWLAKNHEASEDAKEWTFTLDERAMFQDGTPVTADAVVYSITRVQQINKGVAWMFKGILGENGTTAVDDHTVKFTLDEPFAPFLHATAWIFVLNPDVVKQNEKSDDMGQDWLKTNSAGSGPFKIKRWEQNSIFEFDADPNYWRGWEGPHVAGYVHQVMRESSTKRTALEQGKVHAADWLSVDDITLLKKEQGIVVPEAPSISTYTVKLNNKRGPTSDVNVRRAMSYAFDYAGMIDVMSGRAVQINGPLAPTMPMVNKNITAYATDLEKAKAELAKSDQYKDGFEIEFTYVTGLEEERKTGLILLDQLKQLGITVKIVPVEWANAVASFADPEKSPLMFPIYSGSDYPDPDNFLWQSFHSSSAGTWTGADWYNNPDVDKMLADARATTDEAQRTDLYAKVQQTVVDEAVEIFCFSQVGGLPQSAKLEGYEYCPVMGSAPFWYRISLKS